MAWILLPRGISGGRIPAYLERLIEARDSTDLYVAVEISLQRIGVRYFHFGMERRIRPGEELLRQVASNVNPEWLTKYFARNYIECDPRIHHYRNHATPLLWDGRELVCRGGIVGEIFEEASAYGIAAGISIPLRTPRGTAGFTAIFDDRRDFRDRTCTDARYTQSLGLVYTIGAYVYEAVWLERAGPLPRRLGSREELSQRERDVLLFTMTGRRTNEIALALGITPRTVYFHWSSILRKLHARDRPHAIGIALANQVVMP